ncbi:heme exporter protein CcmD [Uliginosibacterium sp. H3]|uniref:Heme exporter protein D n=1 Tax=Uliginosibacterium silvisoli TaxID=3114758 RepID=A0ABU6K8F6_9RHOO|nr:heme exporter protein CcmD [Uliginosibacterium sp. H3]
MIWDSFSAFIDMGGRGAFVWGSYGVTFLLIVAELWLLSRRRRDTLQRLRRLQQLEEPRDTQPQQQ